MEVRIFFGFQFVSEFYSKIKLEYHLSRAISQIENEHINRGVKINYQLTDIESTKNILDTIRYQINESDICVFELSDRNLNVFFEFGIAFALDKKIICMVNERVDSSTMPSDLDGIIIKKYNEQYFEITLTEEINQKLLQLINDKDYYKSIIELDRASLVNIVCPEIPEVYRHKFSTKFAQDYIRKSKFGDMDTLDLISKHIARTFPEVQINEYVSSEVPVNLYESDIICIGGPDWNSLTHDLLSVYKVPIKYEKTSDSFNIKNLNDGREYRLELSEDGKVIRDVGVYLKLPIDGSENKSIYMFNGIQTYGVLGSALSLITSNMRKKNLEYLNRLSQSKRFFGMVVFSFSIIDGNVFPGLIEDNLVFEFDEKLKMFSQIEED